MTPGEGQVFCKPDEVLQIWGMNWVRLKPPQGSPTLQEALLVKGPTVQQARNLGHGVPGPWSCWGPDDRPK